MQTNPWARTRRLRALMHPRIAPNAAVKDTQAICAPALNFDTNMRQVQKSHNQHFSVTGPFANVDKRIDPSFDDVNGDNSLSKKLESSKPHQDLSPRPANGWKDLVIGVSEEERKTFVRPLSHHKRHLTMNQLNSICRNQRLALRGRSDAANAWSTDRSSTLVPDQSK